VKEIYTYKRLHFVIHTNDCGCIWSYIQTADTPFGWSVSLIQGYNKFADGFSDDDDETIYLSNSRKEE